jgi:hypothetical protein
LEASEIETGNGRTAVSLNSEVVLLGNGMSFVWKDATEEQLTRWNARLRESTAPIKEESEGEPILIHVEGSVVIFQTKRGFYFRRGAVESAVEEELTAKERIYLCRPFELSDPVPLLERFQEVYGKKARQIDTHLFTLPPAGMTLLLCLFPSSVVRLMMCESGGMLKTVFKGNTQDLRHIPALQHFLQFPDGDRYVESVFATRYERGNYEAVRALHYQIVKEVIEMKRDRGGPITLGPIAQWDA